MNLYYRIKNTISDAWYDFRSRCQRFKRGWAYGDVWDIDLWFIRTVKPMLVHLYHNYTGVPMEFEDNPDGWKEVLNEMITCLELMGEENKNRFFELFSKYFFDLWD